MAHKKKSTDIIYNSEVAGLDPTVKARRQRRQLEDLLKCVSNENLLKRHADLQAALDAVKAEAKRRIEDAGGALREIAG